MLLVFMLCLGLLTHSLFILSMILVCLIFLNSMFTPFCNESAMCSLEKCHLKITIIIIIVLRQPLKCDDDKNDKR